jgi:hypothetical protein
MNSNEDKIPSPEPHMVVEPVVPITAGIPELRVSLIARAVRQTLRNYGHKVAESTLPECIAGDVERTLVAHDQTWTPSKPTRDCGVNGGVLSERRDNIGSAYTRSTPSPQTNTTGWEDEFNALSPEEQGKIRHCADTFGVPLIAAYHRAKDLDVIEASPSPESREEA